MVGFLLWLVRCTFPKMLYAVNQLAAHCNSFDSTHTTAVRRCMQYAKGRKSQCLTLRRSSGPLQLMAFCDADFMGEPEGDELACRSLSGLVVHFQGAGFIYGQSSPQSTLSRSTAEAEYRSGGTGCQVVMGLRNQMEELGLAQVAPTTIWGDNEACIKMTLSEFCSTNMRHIKSDHHYIRQCVRKKAVVMQYCPTAKMVADIMTKALAKKQFETLSIILHHQL
jgi:hypothetical protein